MKELAKQCIEHVGGAANIQAVSHCATRLRLTLRDQSQVNEAALTALPEVIKVMDWRKPRRNTSLSIMFPIRFSISCRFI